MNNKFLSINEFVGQRNNEKLLFTAGPAALLPENITGLRSCFGRGDADYDAVEERVLGSLKKMSGHEQIVRMQGSASLGLEIMALNFLFGSILVVRSGYYSERLAALSVSAKRRLHEIHEVQCVDWNALDAVSGNFDWIISCYTETSRGLKIPIEMLRFHADRLGARLMLDATASIGLEQSHDLADVIAYSSCKGLFGLAGAAFIAYNERPTVDVDSFNLSIKSHENREMTGPYHAIASLDQVLCKHEEFLYAVKENKRIFQKNYAASLSVEPENQPLLCTHVNCEIRTQEPRAVLYTPRSNKLGSVVCHLGEVHLERNAQGLIQNILEVR